MGESRTVEVLRKARALIERPEAWTKGEMARDASGAPRHWSSAAATCWCAEGAIHLSGLTRVPDAIGALLNGYASLFSFNDDPTTTHADVLALFDRAIAAELAKETP